MCSGCQAPPDIARVENFQTGWMHSPEHRRNILTKGLKSFGFGIAGANGRIYADQMFAGPGTPQGVGLAETPTPVAPEDRTRRMAEALNKARTRVGASNLQPNQALIAAARHIVEQTTDGQFSSQSVDLLAALPDEARHEWRSVRLLTATCGGCGTQITDADIRSFAEQWTSDPQLSKTLSDKDVTAIGVAMEASGTGRKTAVAVLGVPR